MFRLGMTALGLAAIALGLQAVKWITGERNKVHPTQKHDSTTTKAGPKWHGDGELPNAKNSQRSGRADKNEGKGASLRHIRFQDKATNGSFQHYSDDDEDIDGSVISDASTFMEARVQPDHSNASAKSPYECSSVQWGLPPFESSAFSMHAGAGQDEAAEPKHSRRPSFPTVDYEPETTGFSSLSQGGEMDLLPAPTEAGDLFNREEVDQALEEIGEQEIGARRQSRSFSEPNLAKLAQELAQAHSPDLVGRTQISSEDEESTCSPTIAKDQAASYKAHAERDILGSEFSSSSKNGISTSLPPRAPESNKRAREDAEAAPLLRLEIIAGPSRGRDFTADDSSMKVTIGRFPNNTVTIDDNEVSGRHVTLEWEAKKRRWQARDEGSLNGTRLNGNFISNTIRKPGKIWRLNTDDILLLGQRTSIKVIYMPNAPKPILPHNLRKLYAPPSGLQPTLTLRSEAMASLRAELGIERSIQEPSLRLEGAVVCHSGQEHRRKGQACEDMPFLGEAGRFGAALYCVFDGHLGLRSSSECASILPEELRKRMQDLKPRLDGGEGADDVWEDVFLATDAALETEDGTTATAVLVWKDKKDHICLQAANVGDSAAVFCKDTEEPGAEFRKLTVDHRITEPGEKQRLADLGIQLGKNRTRLYGLNLSRCLGDQFIKGADLGFTAVPSVSQVAKLLPHESGILVLASDGLWDVTEPGRVMEIAFEAHRKPHSNVDGIAQAVYQHAMQQRSRDDVTIVVLVFYSSNSALGDKAELRV